MGKQSSSSRKEEKHNLFVWKKKLECLNKKNKVCFDLKSEKRKQRERLKELERLRNRRQEIANQKTKLEEDKRQAMAYQLQQDWENRKQEDQRFLYQQSLLRSDIRLRQGRPKPIDLLRKHLHSGGIGFPAYAVFKGLPLKDMEELLDEIRLNLDFDRATTTYTQFWQSLLLLCDWEISQLQAAADHVDDSLQHKTKLELHSSIEEDVEYFLKAKTHKELEDLHTQTESQLHSGNAKVVEFWEALLTRLHIYKERACLDEIQVKLLSDVEPSSTAANSVIQQEPADNGEVIDDIDMPYEELERKRPADQQCRLQNSTIGKDDALLLSDAEVVNLDSQVYCWSDKYRPRKPKYLNRVLTGYEWNKYNRTHYDHDSPPPKAVQGYRFTILYPDLLDKSKTPQFIIEKDGSNVETCIIRFCAGPPYEDIAFRIVNKEWRTSKKDGFKCTFEAEILRLHFNLQRYPYRR